MTRMSGQPVMVWDFEDRLQATSRQVVSQGQVPEMAYYVYTWQGDRVRKVVESQAGPNSRATPQKLHERIYVRDLEIFRKYNRSGSDAEGEDNNSPALTLERTTFHARAADYGLIADICSRTQGSDAGVPRQTRVQLRNHLGSAMAELDGGTGAVLSYEEYYPFGSSSYTATSSSASSGVGGPGVAKRFRFSGKELDSESGLYFFGARYLAPWLGRWTAADPVIGAGSAYVYAADSPVCLIDPDGRDPVLPSPDAAKDLTGMFGDPNFPAASQASPAGQPTDSASERVEKVIQETKSKYGPTQFGRIPHGAAGFKDMLDDNNPATPKEKRHPSSNHQVGHFLTAVRLGYQPKELTRFNPNIYVLPIAGCSSNIMITPDACGERPQNYADLLGAPSGMDAEEVAIRSIVGHEKVADYNPEGWYKYPVLLQYKKAQAAAVQFAAATAADVATWRRADAALGAGPVLDLDKALAVLKDPASGITVDETKDGNSYPDLLLSLLGWRLGREVQQGKITDRAQVEQWIKTNIHR